MDTVVPPPPPRPRRPLRIAVNVDEETMRTLDALAAMSRQSRSAVAAEVLAALVPSYRPLAEAMAVLHSQPQRAMESINAQAEALALAAENAVREARRLRTPPLSNTGG